MLILSQILSSERLLNIRNDISYVFDSNRNPHQAISDAQLPTARGGQISVRSSCRMQDTRKHVAETGRSHAELQRVHEAKRRFPAVVFQFDRNQATHMTRAQNAIRHLLSIGWRKSRVVHATDSRMVAETLSQCACIFAVSIHAHGERFNSAQNLVRFPRTEHATDEFHYAYQSHAVGRVTRDRYAAHRVRMTAQKFCRAVHDEIRAMLQRLTEIWRGKSVVDD